MQRLTKCTWLSTSRSLPTLVIIRRLSVALIVIALLELLATVRQQDYEISNNIAHAVSKTPSPPSPRQCTYEELLLIKRQLPPDDCLKYQQQPWTQRCSLSYATRCGCSSSFQYRTNCTLRCSETHFWFCSCQ